MYGLSEDSELTEVFEKSDNPDMVYKYSIKREEIYLKGTTQSLENQIKQLDDQIAMDSMPVTVPTPVISTEEKEAQKATLEDLVATLKGVK